MRATIKNECRAAYARHAADNSFKLSKFHAYGDLASRCGWNVPHFALNGSSERPHFCVRLHVSYGSNEKLLSAICFPLLPQTGTAPTPKGFSAVPR